MLIVRKIYFQVDTFLFAGHDTTSHSISWTVWCLATNPDKQERLYQEIIGTFGQSDAEFCTNKLKDFKYLDAVIKESMRIYPPVPFIGRTLQNDVQVGEHLLPKGTSIIIPQMFIHHNQKVFPNHWNFEPENFLNGQEYPSNAYIPFSAGPRNCIGMRFAQSEVRITIAHLILNFQFSSPHKMTDNWTNSEMILRPGIGIPVHLKRRF
ncbi:Cytochrome P450 [Aphelenchoides bicaudatus]|nr:Cytochrome P450 [Aphelenchoides bicaudatus]